MGPAKAGSSLRFDRGHGAGGIKADRAGG